MKKQSHLFSVAYNAASGCALEPTRQPPSVRWKDGGLGRFIS
jgi:hypothetical protein